MDVKKYILILEIISSMEDEIRGFDLIEADVLYAGETRSGNRYPLSWRVDCEEGEFKKIGIHTDNQHIRQS